MKSKRTTARSIMTTEEIKTKGLPWYKTKAWEERKLARKIRVIKREQPEKAQMLGL